MAMGPVRMHPLPVQLPVRRADLGQPERRSARLDVQPDLQRQLHAAGDHPDDCCRRADLQGRSAAVCGAGAVRAKYFSRYARYERTGIFVCRFVGGGVLDAPRRGQDPSLQADY